MRFSLASLRQGRGLPATASVSTALESRRSRRAYVPVALAALAIAGCASVQPGRAIDIATASTSHLLCSAVFVSGRDPAQAYHEEMLPETGMGLLDVGLRYDVDPVHRQVRTRFAGGFENVAQYRDGLGCTELHGQALSPAAAAPVPATPSHLSLEAPATPVEPEDARLRAALDAAFAEPAAPPWRHTKAVVVVHDGRIVGERYAADSGPETPMHGHSMSKTVTQALIGILVRRGALALDQHAPVPEWNHEGDPRRTVTVEQLLRMSSGLPADETFGGFDLSSRMWHQESDMAAFAAGVPLAAEPGTQWHYSDLSFMLLSRMVRDAAGGSVDDVLRFAHRELFDPVGMKHATIEFDGRGTPVGASHIYASPRDWARFGQLLLDDGRAGGLQILPTGWLAHARTPTLDTSYGLGLWLNADAQGRITPLALPGVPPDAFFARGYLGQYLVVVPSRHLLVVRLGVSHASDGDLAGVARLVSSVAAALS
jgi:CubicO group peptidase (beta-lactamase class C family)